MPLFVASCVLRPLNDDAAHTVSFCALLVSSANIESAKEAGLVSAKSKCDVPEDWTLAMPMLIEEVQRKVILDESLRILEDEPVRHGKKSLAHNAVLCVLAVCTGIQAVHFVKWLIHLF